MFTKKERKSGREIWLTHWHIKTVPHNPSIAIFQHVHLFHDELCEQIHLFIWVTCQIKSSVASKPFGVNCMWGKFSFNSTVEWKGNFVTSVTIKSNIKISSSFRITKTKLSVLLDLCLSRLSQALKTLDLVCSIKINRMEKIQIICWKGSAQKLWWGLGLRHACELSEDRTDNNTRIHAWLLPSLCATSVFLRQLRDLSYFWISCALTSSTSSGGTNASIGKDLLYCRPNR